MTPLVETAHFHPDRASENPHDSWLALSLRCPACRARAFYRLSLYRLRCLAGNCCPHCGAGYGLRPARVELLATVLALADAVTEHEVTAVLFP